MNLKKFRTIQFRAHFFIGMQFQHLKWRKENRIDTILKDLNGKCGSFFPIQTDSVSRRRLPIATLRVRDMDTRKVILSGKSREYNLCFYRFWEQMRTSILAQNERFGTSNITGFIFVADLEGFNYRQHACIQCVTAYVNLMPVFDANYPGMLHKAYLVNSKYAYDICDDIVEQ